MTNDTALATIGPLQQALALASEAGDIKALKDVAAMAAALQKGAKARGMGVESENKAAEVVLRAERAIGQTLQLLRSKGVVGPQVGGYSRAVKAGEAASLPEGARTLAELGLPTGGVALTNLKLLAELPESVFNELIAEAEEKVERLAKVDFYRLAQRGKTKLEPIRTVEQAKRMIERQDESADAPTSVFEAFKAAADALDMSQLPLDELAQVALIIQQLAADYTAEKKARHG